jgi:hypothetical protein
MIHPDVLRDAPGFRESFQAASPSTHHTTPASA